MNKTFNDRNDFEAFVDCSLTLQLRQKGKELLRLRKVSFKEEI